MGKLRALYCRHSLGGAPLPPDGTPDHAAFAAAVFAVLARYESLGGAGYQAALGESAFDVLKRRLGVGCEAFASPLNCRYGRFCSAFPDVDRPFGSLGSFFDFAPERGSFEMNPPFVPEVLLAAAAHAEKLLAAAETAGDRLSFAVVVPAWREVPMWGALEGSAFRRGEALIITAAAHGFCDGAQHCRPPSERHRVSSYDTGVFFLQTTNGARRWPVTEDIRKELTAGMAAAVGSAQTVGDLEKRYRGAGKGGGGSAGGVDGAAAAAAITGGGGGKETNEGGAKSKLAEKRSGGGGGGEAAAGGDGSGVGGDDAGDKKRRRRRRKPDE